MSKNTTPNRDWYVTVVAAIVGLVVLCVALLLLPISSLTEGIFFGAGILFVIVCAITAFEGKKGTMKNLFYLLTFWK